MKIFEEYKEEISELMARARYICIFFVVVFVASCLLSPYVIQLYTNYLGLEIYAFTPFQEINSFLSFAWYFTLIWTGIFALYQMYLLLKPVYVIPKIVNKIVLLSVLCLAAFVFGSTIASKYVLYGLLKQTIYINQWSINSVLDLSFMIGMTFVCGILIMYILPILTKFNIIEPKTLDKSRKIVFAVLLVGVSYLTPTTDVISLGMTFMPIYLSFEVGTIASKIVRRKDNGMGNTRNSNSCSNLDNVVRRTESSSVG